MMCRIPRTKWFQGIYGVCTSMHSAKHTGYEPVYIPALFYERNESWNSAFIISWIVKMCEYDALEGINLVLEAHKFGYGFVAEKRWFRSSFLDRKVLSTYPSLGSSISFKLIYSLYSKRPLNSGLCRWNRSLARMNETYVRMRGPYPCKKSQEIKISGQKTAHEWNPPLLVSFETVRAQVSNHPVWPWASLRA